MYLSGTSMATPHVAGAAAVYHSQSEYQLSASELYQQLLAFATEDVLRNIPNATTPDSTPNLLVYVEPCGVDGPESNDMSSTAKSIRTTNNFLSVGFVFILCLNIGLQTTPKAIKNLVTNKIKFPIIILIQVFTVPLLCLIFTKTLQMHFEKLMTVFFVSMFPGGVISNLTFVHKDQRNFRLSTVVSFLQNTVSVISIPLVMLVLWSARSDSVNDSDLSWIRLLIMMFSMLLMSLIGLYLRLSLSEDSCKRALTVSRDLSTALSIFVMLLVLLLYGAKVLRASLGLWAAAILVQLGCGLSGVMTSAMFNSKASESITIGTEFAFRNSILAIGVSSFAFGGDLREDMMIFCVIHSFIASLIVMVLTPVFHCCSCLSGGSKNSSTNDSVVHLESGLISVNDIRSDLSGHSSSTVNDAY
jgi:predicted Na+-dependent transporter